MHLVSLYQWITSNITGCEVAPALCYTVNGDWLCQWERAIFDSQGIHTPWPNTKKLLLVIMSATPTVVPNLVQICPRGDFWANGWNMTNFYLFIYLYLSSGNSPTGQTRRRIFTLDGSNFWLGSFVDIAPDFGFEIPPKPQFGAWIGVFKPTVQNIESFILSKLRLQLQHRFQPNFAQR